MILSHVFLRRETHCLAIRIMSKPHDRCVYLMSCLFSSKEPTCTNSSDCPLRYQLLLSRQFFLAGYSHSWPSRKPRFCWFVVCVALGRDAEAMTTPWTTVDAMKKCEQRYRYPRGCGLTCSPNLLCKIADQLACSQQSEMVAKPPLTCVVRLLLWGEFLANQMRKSMYMADSLRRALLIDVDIGAVPGSQTERGPAKWCMN